MNTDMKIDPVRLTLREAADLLNSGKITSVELTQLFIDRINAVEEKVGALLAVDADKALAAAKEADLTGSP